MQFNLLTNFNCDFKTNKKQPWVIEDKKPDKDWPSQGVVTFNDYGLKYREELDFVLNKINCEIKASEKVKFLCARSICFNIVHLSINLNLNLDRNRRSYRCRQKQSYSRPFSSNRAQCRSNHNRRCGHQTNRFARSAPKSDNYTARSSPVFGHAASQSRSVRRSHRRTAVECARTGSPERFRGKL